MADFIISSNFSGQYTLQNAGFVYLFTEDVTGINMGAPTVYEASNLGFNTIELAGTLMNSDSYGIEIAGTDTDIDIDIKSSGQITAYQGAHLLGSGQSITNAGTIDCDFVGVRMEAENGTLTNTGSISADFAISIKAEADHALIVNNGSIDAAAAGMFVSAAHVTIKLGRDSDITVADGGAAFAVDGAADQIVKITNAGTITADFILSGSSGRDDIKNTGTMTGNVYLNSGSDSFDTSHGKFSGLIVGGTGDDVISVNSAKTAIFEAVGEGMDTIRSTVGLSLLSTVLKDQELENARLLGDKNVNLTGNALANQLTGNAGHNKLNGGEGVDFLIGGKGNDRLTGGGDADTFQFGTGQGRDTIVDFSSADNETIDLADWKAIQSFNSVKSHAHNDGENVVIEAGRDSLTILGMHKADLAVGDFTFS